MACSKCSRVSVDGSNFCNGCGHAIPGECPVCFGEDVVSVTECGHKLCVTCYWNLIGEKRCPTCRKVLQKVPTTVGRRKRVVRKPKMDPNFIHIVEVNNANIEDLIQIQGVGLKTALSIINERTNRNFLNVNEMIKRVPGLGKHFKQLPSYVYLCF